MSLNNSNRSLQIESCAHGVSTVSEVAIQADRDAEDEQELRKANCEKLNFDEPFLFSDVQLVVQNRALHCHRVILSLYSPVFKAMFQNQCLESVKNQVVIPGNVYDIVKEILLHMYTPDGIDMSVESAWNLLPVVHRYEIRSLIDMVERTLSFRLNDSNTMMCLKAAETYGLTRLRQAALECCGRLDGTRLAAAFSECPIPSDLKNEILERRIAVLEKCIFDIQRSFTHTCTKVESRMERIPSNHCPEHDRPLALSIITPIEPPRAMSSPLDVNHEPERSPVTQEQNEQQQQPRAARIDLAANIIPTTAARGITNQMPVNEAPSTSPDKTMSVVCEKCVECLRAHIIELCKRGMHKTPIIVCKQN